MKDKIFIFIIGVLVGAVLSTGAFYIYTATTSSNCSTRDTHMNGGEPPEKPDGDNGGEPPEKPDGDNGEKPPEKPSE
jgi:hypothetical protein